MGRPNNVRRIGSLLFTPKKENRIVYYSPIIPMSLSNWFSSSPFSRMVEFPGRRRLRIRMVPSRVWWVLWVSKLTIPTRTNAFPPSGGFRPTPSLALFPFPFPSKTLLSKHVDANRHLGGGRGVVEEYYPRILQPFSRCVGQTLNRHDTFEFARVIFVKLVRTVQHSPYHIFRNRHMGLQ